MYLFEVNINLNVNVDVSTYLFTIHISSKEPYPNSFKKTLQIRIKKEPFFLLLLSETLKSTVYAGSPVLLP